MRSSIESDALIREVKKRPPVWNMSSTEYHDRARRNRCWDEITAVFAAGKDSTKYELVELKQALKIRWKGLRDSFSRELKRQKKAAAGLITANSTYVYYRRLKFLAPILRSAGAASVADEDDNDNDAGGGDDNGTEMAEADALAATSSEDDEPIATAGRGRDAIKCEPDFSSEADEDSEPEQPMTKFARLNGPAAQTTAESRTSRRRQLDYAGEGERMFLLSLLGPLLQVPQRARLAVQMDIMRVINDAIQTEPDDR